MNPNQQPQGQGENPFLKILQQHQAQMPSGGDGVNPLAGILGGAGAPQQAPAQPAGPGGMAQELPDVGQKGVTGDSTKPLIAAMQALHAYIADSTDRKDIAVVRSVMSLLTNLIQRDQQRGYQMDQQNQAQAQVPPQQ